MDGGARSLRVVALAAILAAASDACALDRWLSGDSSQHSDAIRLTAAEMPLIRAPGTEGQADGTAILTPASLGEPAGEPDDWSPGAGSGEISQAPQLGAAPKDYSRYFLRQQTVLLEPGQWEFDAGLTYGLTETDVPVAVLDQGGAVVGVVGGRIRQRLLIAPLAVRFGLAPRVQLFLDAPVGWANTEFSTQGIDEYSNVGGIGDVNLGGSVLVWRGCGHRPDVIATFAATFPTGNDAFPLVAVSPDSQLGEGFFAAAVNLLFVQTFDPIVIFYGGGYRHRFDDEFLGVLVDPGEQIAYQFGLGFGVNERITLSGSFLGYYISEFSVAGDGVEGSTLEPMRLRLSATILSRGKIVEPFAEVGMTDDAPSARFGIVWTF